MTHHFLGDGQFVFLHLHLLVIGLWTIQANFGLLRAARRPGSWLRGQ